MNIFLKIVNFFLICELLFKILLNVKSFFWRIMNLFQIYEHFLKLCELLLIRVFFFSNFIIFFRLIVFFFGSQPGRPFYFEGNLVNLCNQKKGQARSFVLGRPIRACALAPVLLAFMKFFLKIMHDFQIYDFFQNSQTFSNL